MNLLFALFVSKIASKHCAIDLTSNKYYIDLNDNGAKISQAINDNQRQIFSTEKVISGTVYLNIAVKLDNNKHALNIGTNSFDPVNLAVNLKNPNAKSFTINFLNWNAKNTASLTFYSDVPLFFTNIPFNVEIKVIKGDQLISHILPKNKIDNLIKARNALLLADPENGSTTDSPDSDNSTTNSSSSDNSTTNSSETDFASYSEDISTNGTDLITSESTNLDSDIVVETPAKTLEKTPEPSSTPRETPTASKSPTLTRSPTPTLSPTPDPIAEPPEETYEASSPSIKLTNDGFKDGDKQENLKQPSSSDTVQKVMVSGEVTISQDQPLTSSTPLYFSAKGSDSVFTVDKTVIDSKIGFTTDNNPKVQLVKEDNPVSFLNNQPEGTITISIPESSGGDSGSGNQDITSLNLSEVNNRRGDFSIIVPSQIEKVQFTSVAMFRKSSFSVVKSGPTTDTASDNRQSSKLLEEEFVNVNVDEINISPQSDATFNNVALQKKLELYDNSTATFSQGSKFGSSSEIIVNLQKSKTYSSRQQPLVLFEDPLTTLPEKITLKSVDGSEVDFSNLPLIGSRSQSSECDKIGNIIYLDQGKKIEKANVQCKTVNGVQGAYLTAKEKDNNSKDNKKLSSGAIAAIVVAAIIVLTIIIAIIVIFAYRKKNNSDNNDVLDMESQDGQ